MNEKNAKRLYETIAQIISEREKVQISVTVEKVNENEDIERSSMFIAK